MSQQLKLCKDCKWAAPQRLKLNRWPFDKRVLVEYKFAKCLHNSSKRGEDTTDLVTGEVQEAEYSYCGTQRLDLTGKCLPEGQYWEPS